MKIFTGTSLRLLVFYLCGLDDSLVPVYFRFTLTFRSLFYPLLPLYYFTVGPFCDIPIYRILRTILEYLHGCLVVFFTIPTCITLNNSLWSYY